MLEYPTNLYGVHFEADTVFLWWNLSAVSIVSNESDSKKISVTAPPRKKLSQNPFTPDGTIMVLTADE